MVGMLLFLFARRSNGIPPAARKLPWIPAKMQRVGNVVIEVVCLFCEEGKGFWGSIYRAKECLF